VTPSYDPYGLLNASNQFAGTASSYALGKGQLALGNSQLGLDRELGTAKLALDRSIADQNYNLGQQQVGLGYAQLGLSKEDLALRRELGMSELDIARDQVKATLAQIAANRYATDKQFELGQLGLGLGERERQDALQMGNRQLDLEAMAQEFNRIMRGVSEASVRGGAGVPTSGLYR
jgi:hypothetical protein